MEKTHILAALACFLLPVGVVLATGAGVFDPEPRTGLGTLYYFYQPC